MHNRSYRPVSGSLISFSPRMSIEYRTEHTCTDVYISPKLTSRKRAKQYMQLSLWLVLIADKGSLEAVI